MTVLLQLIVSGIMVGGVYGLIAMGFVVVYRSGRVFNMAYGQFAVLGAFLFWTFVGPPSAPRLDWPLALVLTLAVSVVFGLFIERVIFRRMIGKPVFTSFILTLGLLAIMDSAVVLIWGPSTLPLAPTLPAGIITLGEISFSQQYLWTFLIALLFMVLFTLFLRRTRLGLAIRAANTNQVVARSLGVSASGTSQLAWVLCTVLATLGGILVAVVQGASTLLSELVMVVLIIVLIGGMGSIAGCIVGGLILAIGENLASYYWGLHIQGIGGIFGVVMVLLVLLIRPNGIFGSKPVERV